MERPIFRAVSARCANGSLTHYRGDEFELRGWPGRWDGDMEPVNDAARRILAYRARWRYSPAFPASLINANGDIFLPAYPTPHRAGYLLPAEEHPSETMPRYRLKWVVTLGGIRHESGAVVAFLAWPTAAMQPINEPARRITAYLARNEGNSRLPHSPWCCYRLGPYLPVLSADEVQSPGGRFTMNPGPKSQRRPRGARPRVTAA